MRFMQFVIALTIPVMASITAQAQNPADPSLMVIYGSSVPADLEDVLNDNRGPSRRVGGEVISVHFRAPLDLTLIRLSAFSRSGRGKVLVHKVVVNQTEVALTGMLDAGAAAEVSAGLNAVQDVELTVEGYSHNDSSLMIEMQATGGIAFADFVIHRSGRGSLGGFFDESLYPQFSYRDIIDLFTTGNTPSLNDLDGTTWVCSFYSRPSGKDIDSRTRQYFSNNGRLQSSSDRSTEIGNWILTKTGWKQPLDIGYNCGDIPGAIHLRRTPAGNLVSEIVVDREALIRICRNAGRETESYIRDFTTRSVLEPDRSLAIAQEFCRPARL